MITIKIAQIPIGIDNKYDYIESLAAEYLTDEEPIFTVSTTEAELDVERTMTEVEFSNGYLESMRRLYPVLAKPHPASQSDVHFDMPHLSAESFPECRCRCQV